MNKTYQGWRLFAATLVEAGELESERHMASGVRVVVRLEDGFERPLRLRPELRLHSSEFNWGYGGSGPSQLAMAILADCFGWEEQPDMDPGLYQQFKRDFVSRWEDEWQITTREIHAWREQR